MSTTLANRIAALSNGLLCLYRCDSRVGTELDSSGHGRGLTASDETGARGPDGFDNSAMSVEQGSVGPSGTVSIPASTAYTLAAWVKITGPASDVNNFIKLSDAGSDSIILYSNTEDSLGFSTGEESDQATATGIAGGQWHHVALTTTTTTAKLYFDGVLVMSTLSDLTSVGIITSIALASDVTADSLSMQHPAAWSRVLTDGGVTVGNPVGTDSEIGWLWNGGEPFDPTFDPADIAFVDFNSSGIFVLNQSPIEEAGRRLNRDLKELAAGNLKKLNVRSTTDETFKMHTTGSIDINGNVHVAIDSVNDITLSSDGGVTINGADGGVAIDGGGFGITLTTGDETIPVVLNGALACSSQYSKILRPLFDHYTDVASTGTNGTENDLYTDTLVANIFAANGAKVFAEYAFTIVGSATATRRIQAYLGGTKVLDSGTLTFASGGTARMYITAIRETSTVVRVIVEFVPSGIALQPIETHTRITGLTLTNTQTIKVTGIATGTGAASGDIVAKIGVGTGMAAA